METKSITLQLRMNTAKRFLNEDHILCMKTASRRPKHTKFYVVQNTEHKRMFNTQELHYP